ncbi:MAG: bifunctional proline dehydrogenase/L-glutamate gamma-semialdehyde dehydrogenase, partial [Desulfobacteraceae bacterium]|nr:bifunctional proline dehydrogenase/L-glutamate gamma-semialdehyde dehydrogenase [Desulfobacteraceae bacterium]
MQSTTESIRNRDREAPASTGSGRDERIVREAVSLAEAWQNRANRLITPGEKAVQKKMMRLLTHPTDKVVMTRLIDQSFRSANEARVAERVAGLLNEYGIPRFFSLKERLLARLFLIAGRLVPRAAVPRMIEAMREESSRAIIPGEPEVFHAHLAKRKAEGVRMNVNHLGEALLGEEEARVRLDKYVEALRSPEIEYISVKISTIYSQIHSLAFDHTVAVLRERLARLYRTAAEHFFTHNDGRRVPKFVNLDMEEYRDLDITMAAFMQTLDREEFRSHSAGIVLQAYLPDSYLNQRKLTEWAKKRVEGGGSPIKLRIVKGANMEMEQLEASLFDWPLAPYDNKLDVDANYKRMVDYGMEPENIRAVRLGIASHNLFELAYARKVAEYNGVTEHFGFEMLEGMADHVRRAIQEMTGEVLLYAPVASKDQFINAIGYLVRRLDENTAPENFLRYSPYLKTGSRQWTFLRDQFLAACRHRHDAGKTPHRVQNRLLESFSDMGTFHDGAFRNEPNTDWSLAPNREWAKAIRREWKKPPQNVPLEIPVVAAGRERFAERPTKDVFDPSQYEERVLVARFALADEEDIERAVATARADPDGWRQKNAYRRHEVLSKVAMELRRARGDLIG